MATFTMDVSTTVMGRYDMVWPTGALPTSLSVSSLQCIVKAESRLNLQRILCRVYVAVKTGDNNIMTVTKEMSLDAMDSESANQSHDIVYLNMRPYYSEGGMQFAP